MQEPVTLITSNQPQNGGGVHLESLHIDLDITDSVVIRYLSPFEEADRAHRALEALNVGVIAIQSASPTLDTHIVDAKFRELSRDLDEYVGDFRDELKEQMETHFNGGNGSVPRRLESLFGADGSLRNLFNQYFSPDGGRLAQLLQAEIGPASKFARSLDPTNREGVISRIEAVVSASLDRRIGTLVGEFSLDKEESAIARLNKSVSSEVRAIQEQLRAFFGELKESLGIEAGKAQEADRGTQKGREFEVALYEHVAALGRALGDVTENVRGIVGSVDRCKKGDYVITLGDTSGAPGLRIVVEAKKNTGIKLKGAIDELEEAKENRDAVSGIFVFAEGYEPPEVGDFLRIGSDFFVTVSEQALAGQEPALYLEAACKIARAITITNARTDSGNRVNADMLAADVEAIIERVSRFSEIATKARTIRNNSKWIEEQVTEMQATLDDKLAQMSLRLKTAGEVSGEVSIDGASRVLASDRGVCYQKKEMGNNSSDNEGDRASRDIK